MDAMGTYVAQAPTPADAQRVLDAGHVVDLEGTCQRCGTRDCYLRATSLAVLRTAGVLPRRRPLLTNPDRLFPHRVAGRR